MPNDPNRAVDVHDAVAILTEMLQSESGRRKFTPTEIDALNQIVQFAASMAEAAMLNVSLVTCLTKVAKEIHNLSPSFDRALAVAAKVRFPSDR